MQRFHEINKALRDRDIAQTPVVSGLCQQNLVLIFTAQHFLHSPHQPNGIVVLLHLFIQAVAHHRAAQQPGRAHRVAAHHVYFYRFINSGNRINKPTQNGAITTVAAGVVAKN
ncbi:hypothetical protein D3C75_696950 [compost metagenome]